MENHQVFNISDIMLQDIVVTHAAIDNEKGLSSLPEGYSVSYTFGFEASISTDNKTLRVVFHCSAEAFTKDKKDSFGVKATFAIIYNFLVLQNVESMVRDLGDDQIEFNSDVLLSLANIAYSTSRGIIFTRCQGTILKKGILPILPTDQLRSLILASE
ncbi:hypothetical protein QTN47_27440 [Danxiaibacter flavus]|uniref:Uncharacterized protein n=1 Tax=Danxiaibacter flavus TaxID=3049108 RepID=A0ABV3ZPR5_9BACT|nr:hypothetical protein QNM32_27440 [Chitinophagaceae bacterium DXS]